MAGAIAGNLHEGSRSEILADYLFSRWGAVTPVRRQDDYGGDLYCTLTERVGRREQVREYFTVQVKSTEDAWKFDDAQSARWLIEYPTPLFLCTVSKRHLRVRLYHVCPRFIVWSLGHWPERLELAPGEGQSGEFIRWENGSNFSLSAPIIEAGFDDLMDDARLLALRSVFSQWADFDRENCDLVRQGLPRFRMPSSYRTNEIVTEMGEFGVATPQPELLAQGLLNLAEALECLGGLRYNLGDRAFALEAALLLDRIQKEHSSVFSSRPYWRGRRRGLTRVNRRLNDALEQREGGYLYSGLEAVEKMMAEDPLITKYLAGDG